ncbi:MAG TPA: hypothetical protein IGS37_14695 [Synechococcales cyanobacterium M55_K2018_004]|nr:hypothetical protein [Synechococcales cyanobacterium M55_K2018_004]
MARRINRKCQHCATLTVEAAIALHGPTGDNCWNPGNANGWGYDCHRRRSHYRHRDDNNRTRRRLRRAEQAKQQAVLVSSTSTPPGLDSSADDLQHSTAQTKTLSLAALRAETAAPEAEPADANAPHAIPPGRTLHTVTLGDSEYVALDLPPVPLPYAAVLVLYRQHKDAPVHAIGAEIWQGKVKVLNIQPIHCMGMRGNEVTAYIQTMLAELHQHFKVSRFEDVIKELPVHDCPLVPCPLKAAASPTASVSVQPT